MDYIKIFQNAEDLSVYVESSDSDNQMMHTFLDNFHQGGKYSAKIASHQAKSRREVKFTDKKSLSILSLHTDYLNLDRRSGFGRNIERENTVQIKCNFCGGTDHSTEIFFKRIRREKEKAFAAGHLDNRRTERTPRKCFRCEYQDKLIAKCKKPPKENEKRKIQVHFN